MKTCEEEVTPMVSSNHFSKPIAYRHDLYLTSEITEAENYAEWFQLINNASENDIIYVHINSPGGYLATSIQLYSALSNTEAQVVVSVDGECCSGATMILMAADAVNITRDSYFLVHAYSGGNIGKFNNLQENAKFQERWFPSVVRNIYGDFLNEEEIETVLRGVDLWLDSTDVVERFARIAQIRQEKMKQENPEQYSSLVASGLIEEIPVKKETKNSKPKKKSSTKKPAGKEQKTPKKKSKTK